MTRAKGRRGLREVAYLVISDGPVGSTYRSLQIHIIGLRKGFAGVFAIR